MLACFFFFFFTHTTTLLHYQKPMFIIKPPAQIGFYFLCINNCVERFLHNGMCHTNLECCIYRGVYACAAHITFTYKHPIYFFSHQEVPQEAWPAGVVGCSDHSDGVPHSGQVWPQHHHAAHPLRHHAVLVIRNLSNFHLDPVAVLYPVSMGLN